MPVTSGEEGEIKVPVPGVLCVIMPPLKPLGESVAWWREAEFWSHISLAVQRVCK